MPGAWRLGSVIALVGFVAVWAPATWLATRGGHAERPGSSPPSRPATIDGSWRVDPARSSIKTTLVSVSRLGGDARIVDRRLVRAHLSGGRATFDLGRPVSLGEVRQGRTARVVLSGRARLLFLSRGLTVPVDILWFGTHLRISGRSGDNELRLELRRA